MELENTRLFVLLGILVFIIGCGQKAELKKESSQQRHAKIEQAFLEGGDGSDLAGSDLAGSEPVSLEVENRIKDFFDELRVAFDDETGRAIYDAFSVETLFQSAEQRGLLKFESSSQRRHMIDGFKKGFKEGAKSWVGRRWDAHEIRKIERVGPDVYTVFVRHWHDDIESYSKVRWWIVETSPSNFQLYDMEDFDLNHRVSSAISLMMIKVSERPLWVELYIQLGIDIQSDLLEDPLSELAVHQESIDTILASDAPAEVKSFVNSVQVSYLMTAGTDESNQKALKIAGALVEENAHPGAYFYKGNILINLGRYEEAIGYIEDYSEMLGKDSETYKMLAFCNYSLGRLDEAIEAAELGLQDNPNSWTCLSTLALSLPEERRDELLKHFENLDFDQGAMEYTLESAIEYENRELALKLFGWVYERHSDSLSIPIYKDILGIED